MCADQLYNTQILSSPASSTRSAALLCNSNWLTVPPHSLTAPPLPSQPEAHFYVTSVGFCGTDSYVSPYDTRTYDAAGIAQTLNQTQLWNMDVKVWGRGGGGYGRFEGCREGVGRGGEQSENVESCGDQTAAISPPLLDPIRPSARVTRTT